mgnify:FL=1
MIMMFGHDVNKMVDGLLNFYCGGPYFFNYLLSLFVDVFIDHIDLESCLNNAMASFDITLTNMRVYMHPCEHLISIEDAILI